MKNMHRAFGDLLVVELASVLAGPAVGMFFAEMGARVVKVENPETGGDVTRSWRGVAEDPDKPAAYFCSVNWGKRSLAVNLRSPVGREVVHDLVSRADVVLASFKAGDARRLGMDWETLSRLNPRLVYGEVTAYGDDDPRVGYDAVIQAETGFTSMNGTDESGPLKMPVALMDILAAHQLKEGILAALFSRERSGRGCRVSVSLFESGVTALANQATNWLMTGVVPRRLGSAHPNIVPYGTAYRCRDGGFVVLAVGTDRQFSRLCRCLDVEQLASDPRFATNERRVAHRGELEGILAKAVARTDRESLSFRLRDEKVPAGEVRDVGQVLGHPLSSPLVLSDPGGASAVRTRAFVTEEGRGPDPARPPSLSEHARAVLSEVLGYSQDRIVDLMSTGVVAGQEQ
jgi:crotonobetainyl-CoA:carnitine CoA-transferase CaiB-like acyl-CoA transferase